MPTIDSISLYPQIDRYWDLVKRTLERLFNVDPSRADGLRKDVDRSSTQEQLLFYHAEPLDIAADLAGVRPNDDQVQRYLRIAADIGWRLPPP